MARSTAEAVTRPDELDVLHALRVQGLASVDAVAAATGAGQDGVSAVLGELADAELVVERQGRMPGWTLTADGRARHAELLAAAPVDRPALEELYARFLARNEELKAVCTDWQLRPDDGSGDEPVLERLAEVRDDVVAAITDAAAALPRLGAYATRFDDALARVLAGDAGAVARPLDGSFHDTWMHLHQDLLLTLGRSRSDADGS